MMDRHYKAIFRFLPRLITGLLALALSLPSLAGISARLDRNKVYEGDQVTLTIESDGQQTGEPDLAPLNKDFTVLGTSTSSQVSIINGLRSDRTSWIIQLEPRQRGKIQVPPLRVGNETTPALELEVTELPEEIAAQQSEHLFIEVEADSQDATYIQQQIPFTVRLYYDDKVMSGNLSEPQPENAVIEQLGEDKKYTTTRNGIRYYVLERHYAISPEKSGQLHIPPVTFKGQLSTTESGAGLGLRRDPFFERFFLNSPLRHHGQPIRTRSKAITLKVLPRPATAGKDWLPAEQISLHDSWADSPPQWRSGEPVTRTITLQAKGLTGAQLPALQLQTPEQTRLYPEAPVNESRTDGDKVYGISKQTFTYIPGKAGRLTIPAVKLQWWNTRSNQPETAVLPKWEVQVAAGSGETPSDSAAIPEIQDPVTRNATQPAATETLTQEASQVDRFKYWLAAGITLLLAAFVWYGFRKSRYAASATPISKQEKPDTQNSRRLIRRLTTALETACTTNNASATAHTLLELGRARWPDNPPGNLGALAARLDQASEPIMALDRSLYAADTAEWDGSGLWAAVKDAWDTESKKKPSAAEVLRPLYPHQA